MASKVRHYPAGSLELRPGGPGARMWAVALDRTELTYFEVAPRSRFELHAHANEQITLVLEGELYFELEGRTVRVGPGEVIAIPGDVPHAAFTEGSAVRAVDAWSPPRYSPVRAHET